MINAMNGTAEVFKTSEVCSQLPVVSFIRNEPKVSAPLIPETLAILHGKYDKTSEDSCYSDIAGYAILCTVIAGYC
ncbi:MAG: hypothetical protein DRR08_30345 [Candidatus Parabeggiatoa sp. nov. 2]|nr:MAG: hypothetical protein B6247_23010 [Beggiatoa sp. 4572_84]RKZ50383.1 MAG: hypothetical protein DRR08_30345 [Gammaproteobacteria bacterium]